MKSILLGWVVAVSVLFTSGMAPDADVLRVRDRKTISFSRMIQDVMKSNILFVGEVHDVPEHHQAELAIIQAFHEADIPITVGLEMFRSESDKALEAWTSGKLTVEQFLPVYYDNWRQPWPSYRDIFLYLREHQIPAIGLNVPDDIQQTIAEKGFDSLSKAQRKRLPPGISCNVDPTYMEFIRKAYAGHAHASERKFINFCEAQMVWDKTMAWNVVQYLRKHRGRTMIVLTGVGHAWKRGIPEQMAITADAKYSSDVIMPLIPGQIETETVTVNDTDYVLLL